MNKATRNGILILVILAGIFLVTRLQQNQFKSKSTRLFSGQPENIHKVLIQSGNDALELVKISADSWGISGNDTLVMRENRISNLFENVLTVEKGSLVSKNPERWNVYSVDDSAGTHLGLIDAGGKTLGYYVFGRSKSDYAHNYVRIQDEPEVYLTTANVIYHLSTSETFWGEVPKSDEPEDSTRTAENISNESDRTSPVELKLPGDNDSTMGTIELPAAPATENEDSSKSE